MFSSNTHLRLTTFVLCSFAGTLSAGDPLSSNPGASPTAWNISSEDHHGDHDHSVGAAPMGVMGTHSHGAGEWMLSMRYMRMEMSGSRDGTRSLSDSEVLAQGFMVTPTEMTMEMWMLGGMYAPTDDVTLMAMVPYLRNSMDHLTGMGGRFETSSEGLGDVSLSALIPLLREPGGARLQAELGISLPTGSVTERDATPMSASAKLPYPMQLGSGTYDLLWGFSGSQRWGSTTLGGQLKGVMRTGENDQDYRLGNRLEASAWGVHSLVEGTDVSLRLAYFSWSNIHGSDPALNPNMVPTARPDLRGGQRLDVGLGLNQSLGKGLSAGFEVLAPIHQDLDGPQLEVDMTYVVGLELSL